MSELFDAPEITAETLVGAGKKFSDYDALARSKVEADNFIEKLKEETSELRAELQARLTLDEMLQKLPAHQTPTPTRETPATHRQDNGDGKDKTEVVDLAAEVQKLLQKEKQKERRDDNITQVRTELKNRFGADYNAKLKEIADDLSVSTDFLTDMAANSPSGFLKLIDSVAAPDQKKPLTPPMGGMDVSKTGDVTGVRNHAYYRNIKKENPSLYFSKKVQLEMHKEALRQGSAFYS